MMGHSHYTDVISVKDLKQLIGAGNMKGVAIGDIHGRREWSLINPDGVDRMIFNGDYCDSYVYSNAEILSNLQDIIKLKRKYFDKVFLLLGNHDLHYMYENEFSCSGFRPEMYHDLHSLFIHNKDCFQMAHQIGKMIFTHAGISNKWYKMHKETIDEVATKFETKDLADTFNHMMWMKENKILHQVGHLRGGYYDCGGITWADRRETSNDYLVGYHQVVGHTPIETITKFGDDKSSIRYIDVLGTAPEFYQFEF